MTELLTTKEAADLLKCSPSTIERYTRLGKLQADRSITGRKLFEKEQVLKINPLIEAVKSARGKANFNQSGNSASKNGEFKDVIAKWQINSRDSASADVQIGIYTEKIGRLENELMHLSTKDPYFKSLRYTLLKHVGERRKLLYYLEASDFERYKRAMDLLRKESA